MPFLTQGKTNWKFLLIVVVLAVIIGGGIWWCAKKPEKTFQAGDIKNKVERLGFNYKDLLNRTFSNKEFTEVQRRKDCFQDQEDIFYCIENINEDFFTGSEQKNILVVIRKGYFMGEDG